MQVSPHRTLGAVLVLALTSFGFWAALGSLDIVVSAQGRLVPENFVRLSQPSEGGIVKEVLVKDGDPVKAGQVLLKLDALNAQADRSALAAEKTRLEQSLARIDAELGSKPLPAGMPAAAAVEFAARKAAYDAARTEAQLAALKAAAELQAAHAEMSRLQDLEQFASKQERMNVSLKQQGFISEAAFDEKQRDARDAQNRMASQTKTLTALASASQQAQAALLRVQTEYQKALVVEQAQVLAELSKVSSELAKAEHREALTELKAPVRGTVNSLAVKTPGQVVQPGAVLLSVVPENESLIAEVWVRNEDAGFVSPDMPVKVKLATFPFQKYGWIDGKVQWIGADSETPEAMRNAAGELLFYRARVSLSRQHLERDGQRFESKPGMQVLADIQLGERTLLEYLTSPLKKTVLEAARER